LAKLPPLDLDPTVMRWFRDHIRRGSWFALIALAINLGLSFGHVHAIEGNGFGDRSASQIAAIDSPDDGKGDQHGGPADLLCPICMVAGAMHHALASAPPALPLTFAESRIDLRIEPDFAVPLWPRAAFYSRGPPIS
jgi:Protein of unknown function (DUF2946)